MNPPHLKDILSNRQSTAQNQMSVQMVVNSAALFNDLLDLVTDGREPFSSRASWIMGYAGVLRPEWFYPRLGEVIAAANNYPYPALVRNVCRVLRLSRIPEEYLGIVFEQSQSWVFDRDQPIAVRAFSLQTLGNIMERMPVLAGEMALIAESVLPGASPGLSNTAQKVIKSANRLMKLKAV